MFKSLHVFGCSYASPDILLNAGNWDPVAFRSNHDIRERQSKGDPLAFADLFRWKYRNHWTGKIGKLFDIPTHKVSVSSLPGQGNMNILDSFMNQYNYFDENSLVILGQTTGERIEIPAMEGSVSKDLRHGEPTFSAPLGPFLNIHKINDPFFTEAQKDQVFNFVTGFMLDHVASFEKAYRRRLVNAARLVEQATGAKVIVWDRHLWQYFESIGCYEACRKAGHTDFHYSMRGNWQFAQVLHKWLIHQPHKMLFDKREYFDLLDKGLLEGIGVDKQPYWGIVDHKAHALKHARF